MRFALILLPILCSQLFSHQCAPTIFPQIFHYILFYYLLCLGVNLSSDIVIYLDLNLFLLFLTISYCHPIISALSLPLSSPSLFNLCLTALSTRSLQAFLTQLVCNLLDEGNSCFRDGDWRQATQQYGEGISVARYAQAEALVIPHELLESLYVNRATACYQTVRG